jgi:hypothetical protein
MLQFLHLVSNIVEELSACFFQCIFIRPYVSPFLLLNIAQNIFFYDYLRCCDNVVGDFFLCSSCLSSLFFFNVAEKSLYPRLPAQRPQPRSGG